MEPKVSILLPNLNNRPYLDERIQTITGQTFSDWELIIVDNYSDDGAWEFFQECVKKDSRIKISQAPREGMYANWNNCIRQAQGEYVYIATSDDTMTPDFLEIMVDALENYPECHLAHCKLKIIDENGNPHPTLDWDKFYCTLYFGDLVNKKHIRAVPHDGILHCGVRTVYTSITQLLIRRNLFEKIGLFLTKYGSTADFEWEMRASLVANTIHIPQYLATWRVHRDQGTDLDFLHSTQHRNQLIKMMDHALKAAKKINPGLRTIHKRELEHLYKKEKFYLELGKQTNKANKYKTCIKWLLGNPGIVWEYYRYHRREPFISPTEPMDFCRKILTKYGFEKNLARIGKWSLGNPGKISPEINAKHPPIVIYQMSKVGSKSIYYSLKEHPIPNMLFHVHQLNIDAINRWRKIIDERINQIRSQKVSDGVKISRIVYNKNLRGKLNNDIKLREKFNKYKTAFDWKIITLVREPIARMLSDFYFGIQSRYPEATDYKGNIILKKSMDIFKKNLRRFDESKDMTSKWFDNEFKEVIGIDVYDYPFDHEKGYTIIKAGNIEVLIIKLEELDKCFISAMSDFLGIQNARMTRKNTGNEKNYSHIYKKALKSILIDNSICQRIYSAKFVRHFYSQEEIGNFAKKWSKGLNRPA